MFVMKKGRGRIAGGGAPTIFGVASGKLAVICISPGRGLRKSWGVVLLAASCRSLTLFGMTIYGSADVESRPLHKTQGAGHPAAKIEGKGSGQECPLYTTLGCFLYVLRSGSTRKGGAAAALCSQCGGEVTFSSLLSSFRCPSAS